MRMRGFTGSLLAQPLVARSAVVGGLIWLGVTPVVSANMVIMMITPPAAPTWARREALLFCILIALVLDLDGWDVMHLLARWEQVGRPPPMRSCYTYRQDTLAYAVSFVSRNVPNSVQFAKPGGMPPVSGLTHSQGYFLPYPLFEQLAAEYSVLALYRYETLDTLLAALADHAIAPAEQRANEIAPMK